MKRNYKSQAFQHNKNNAWPSFFPLYLFSVLTNHYYSFALVPPAALFFHNCFSSLSLNSSSSFEWMKESKDSGGPTTNLSVLFYYSYEFEEWWQNRFVRKVPTDFCLYEMKISEQWCHLFPSLKTHHIWATQNIYSHSPPRPHFVLFFHQRIGIANYLVYKIIGMELHFVL